MTQGSNETVKTGIQKELLNEVQYQPNSIVSKQIINKESGNITIYALDKDESFSEHISHSAGAAYVVEGEIEIMVDGNPFKVKSGEILVLPPNVSHGLKAVQKSKMLLTLLK